MPDVVGPYPHDGGHPLIRAVEQKFIANQQCYDDLPAPVCDRWMVVRAVLADELRGRHLYDDLTDVYATAVRSWTNPKLFSAYELAALQSWFFIILRNNGLVRSHVQEWVTHTAFAWRTRITERDGATQPWRRAYGDRAILAPHVPPPRMVLSWQN